MSVPIKIISVLDGFSERRLEDIQFAMRVKTSLIWLDAALKSAGWKDMKSWMSSANR